MKKIFKFLVYILIITMLVNATFFYVNAADVTKNTDIYNIVKEFITLKKYKEIDANTFKIVNITELNNRNNGEFFGYLIDVQDANNINAYLVVEATTNKIIEYAEVQSEYLQNIDNVKSDAKLYYSALELWIEDDDKCINLKDGMIVSKKDLIGNVSSQDTMQYSSNYRVTNISRSYPSSSYISNVPDYIQVANVYKCVNTSILNIISYWDLNGFPNLITANSVDQVRADIQTCLDSTGALSSNNNIPNAIRSYVSSHGNYGVDIFMDWNPDYFDFQFEIYYGYPCLLGFPDYYGAPHMTTGVGYEITDGIEYAIVHDNHLDTEYNVTIAFSETDYLCGIGLY